MSALPGGATEIVVVGSAPIVVEGEAREVEAAVLSAARGSIMELVWFTEAGTGNTVGVNPDHVVALRAAA